MAARDLPPSKRQYVRNPMPAFVEFQLCKLEKAAPEGRGWIHEIKYDGYRLQVRVEGGRVTIHTRTGLDWTDKFRALQAFAGELPDFILDGELCALGADGRPDFSALQKALRKDNHPDDLVLFAFDMLFEGREDLRPSA